MTLLTIVIQTGARHAENLELVNYSRRRLPAQQMPNPQTQMVEFGGARWDARGCRMRQPCNNAWHQVVGSCRHRRRAVICQETPPGRLGYEICLLICSIQTKDLHSYPVRAETRIFQDNRLPCSPYLKHDLLH